MTFTKQITTTWSTNWFQDPAYAAGLKDLHDATRLAASEGRADGIKITISETVFVRKWIDQAAADQWVTIVNFIAAKHNLPLVSAVIADVSTIEGPAIVV
jgi:hypothetical protein